MLAICSSGCKEARSPLGVLRGQIISGHSLFPLMRASPSCSSTPRSVGGGQCPEPTSAALQLSPGNDVGSTYHQPRQGTAHIDISGPEIPSEAVPASSWAPLGRKRRRNQGVGPSYVTSFLGVRGPGMSQPSTAGRGWGRARRLASLLCCLSSRPQQTSEAGAALQDSQLQAGTLLLGVGTRKGCCHQSV